jgi:hypothetical protein
MLRARLTLTLLCLTLPLNSLRAQTVSSQAIPSWLETLARPAGIIFSGTVAGIENEAARANQLSAVHVVFRVDDAVRGCGVGETVEIAEWTGLWAGAARYRIGEKVFLFLYPRNAAGRTSPVAGELGVFEIGMGGMLRVSSAQAGDQRQLCADGIATAVSTL